MNVAQYTFQSPSSSQVQIGRLDPNSVKGESRSSSSPVVNETVQKAEAFVATQVSEVSPTVNTEHVLDVYA